MPLLQVDHNPSRRQLALFAALWVVFLGFWGWGAAARGWWTLAWIIWAAMLVPLAGLVVTGLLRTLYVGMIYLIYPVGLLVSLVLFAAVYYLVITPLGLALRLAGYDPLSRSFDRQAASYWVPRPPAPPLERYFRQS